MTFASAVMTPADTGAMKFVLLLMPTTTFPLLAVIPMIDPTVSAIAQHTPPLTMPVICKCSWVTCNSATMCSRSASVNRNPSWLQNPPERSLSRASSRMCSPFSPMLCSSSSKSAAVLGISVCVIVISLLIFSSTWIISFLAHIIFTIIYGIAMRNFLS